jgi:hypothetical protein
MADRRLGAFALVVIALGSACGGGSSPSTPHGPTPLPAPAASPTQIAGAWSATLTRESVIPPALTTSGALSPASYERKYSIVFDLQQSGAIVSGTFRADALSFRGTVSGSVSGTEFQGALTTDGDVCDKVQSYKGSVSQTSLNWTGRSNCPFITRVAVEAHRR